MRATRLPSALWLMALTLLLGPLSPRPSHGQAAPTAVAETPEYQQLVSDAVQEFQQRNFLEARALFARANELLPNARALRGIGLAEFELREYPASIDALEQALDSTVQPLDPALRSETVALLDRARSFVARLRIESDPATAEVLVDGVPAALRDDRTLVLGVGDHLLELRAAGYLPERRAYKVRGGEQETLRIKLGKGESATPLPVVATPSAGPTSTPAPLAPPARDDRRPLYKNPWLWTGIGVAVAAAGVGLGLALRKTDPETSAPISINPVASRPGP